MCAPQLTPQLTNEQIDQISATLGQAAQAIKKLNYGQILNQDDVYALSQAYGCLKATLDWFYQYDREPNTFPEMQSFAWGDSICPALAVIANLLNHLAGGAPLIVLASYVKVPQAVEALAEVSSHVASELFEESNEASAALSLAKEQFQQYDQALPSAIALFKEAYSYITARYGYNATIAPLPAGPIKKTALQIADFYLRDKLPQNKSINLCAHVLLALAGLNENDDWRNATPKPPMKISDIDQWPQQQQFAMQFQWDKQKMRYTALNALRDANIIQLDGYKYHIVPAHLAALQQLTTALDRT